MALSDRKAGKYFRQASKMAPKRYQVSKPANAARFKVQIVPKITVRWRLFSIKIAEFVILK